MQIWFQENLKINKNKCHIRCTKIQLFGEIPYEEGVQPHQKKLAEMATPIIKNNYNPF